MALYLSVVTSRVSVVNKSNLQSKPQSTFTLTRDNTKNIKNKCVNILPWTVKELRVKLQHGVCPKLEFPDVSLKIRSVSLMGVKSRGIASREVVDRCTTVPTNVFLANTRTNNYSRFTVTYYKVTATKEDMPTKQTQAFTRPLLQNKATHTHAH
jgi:hypothetical protein